MRSLKASWKRVGQYEEHRVPVSGYAVRGVLYPFPSVELLQ